MRTLAPPPASVAWGCREDPAPLVDDRCRLFADDYDPLPRAKWKPASLDHLIWHIFDQADGMCTSNAGTQAVMGCRELGGQERRVLAPSTLYGQHSRWGTGSTLSENVDALLKTGVCSAGFSGGEQPWPLSGLPKGWQQDAARHKILPGHVWNLAGQFDLVATALQMSFFGWIGLRWPGGGGHSVLCSSLLRQGNVWIVRGPNSWGPTWNGDGFFELTERQCSSMGSHGAFAVRAVISS